MQLHSLQPDFSPATGISEEDENPPETDRSLRHGATSPLNKPGPICLISKRVVGKAPMARYCTLVGLESLTELGLPSGTCN